MKILRILLAIGMLLPLSLPAQKSKIEDEVALLAARGDLERLRPLYDSVRQSLSPHTALYCRFAMTRGAGHHREVIALIDSLERFHERKLDVRGLLALATERCEAHVALGEYAELEATATNVFRGRNVVVFAKVVEEHYVFTNRWESNGVVCPHRRKSGAVNRSPYPLVVTGLC